METGLKGKIACVGGASRGLGLAVAKGLAAEGAKLAICSRSQSSIDQAAQSIESEFGVEVMAGAVDLSRQGAAEGFVADAASHFGGIDVLVNNTGGPPAGGFDDFSREDWQSAVELTLFSAQAMAREALKSMRKAGDGRIINLTSISVKQPIAELMLSNSIRAAVVGWAKSLADEVGPLGIRVNNVCTGWIYTERVDQLLEHRAKEQGISVEQARSAIEAAIPMGRIGRPEEFADLVVFLASDRSSYITGASYLIDGGLYRGLM